MTCADQPAAVARVPPVVRRGVAGAALAFFAFASLHAVVVPAFLPADEPAHYGYVLHLLGPGLPTIDSAIPRGVDPALDERVTETTVRWPHRTDVWAANHPPLFHALAALPVALADPHARPELAHRLARLVSVLAGTAGIAATGLLAWWLAPGRAVVAVTAAWLVALTPLYVHLGGILYTDALSYAAGTGALAATVRLVRVGWSPRGVAAIALLAAAAASTRASGLVFVAVGAATTTLVALGEGERSEPGGAGISLGEGERSVGRNGVVRAVAGGGAVVAAAAAAAGWFFWRNVGLYGGLSGTTALMEKLGRQRNDVHETFGDPVFWQSQYDQLFDGFVGPSRPLFDTAWQSGTRLLAVLVVIGVAAAALRRRAPTVRAVAAWAVPVAVAAALVAGVASFHAAGGLVHTRYWVTAAGLVATVAALGIRALPGGRHGIPTLLVVGFLVGVNTVGLLGFLTDRRPVPQAGPFGHLVDALARAGVPPTVALASACALVVAGLVLLAHALWSSGVRAATPRGWLGAERPP